MHMQQGRTKTSSSHVITALNKQRSDGDFDSETGVHVSSNMQPSAWMDRDGLNEYLSQLKIALGTPPTARVRTHAEVSLSTSCCKLGELKRMIKGDMREIMVANAREEQKNIPPTRSQIIS
ncbi:MAG: hypothetical protein MHM6MM_009640, partial [Cercozoa sp. M6MM]